MKIKNIILILLIPIIILLANFNLLAFNQGYYEKQFTKNNVYSQIPKEEVDEATRQLINYLRDGNKIEGSYFNEKEKQHLKDVREIIKLLMIILYTAVIAATIIIIISFIENKRTFGMALIGGGLLTIILIILLFIMLTHFEYSFIKFHEITFTNKLWLLDPLKDRLIVMFPENFFYNITQDIAIRSLFTALATTAIGMLFLKKIKAPSKS